MNAVIIGTVVFVVLIIIFLLSGIRIVSQTNFLVIERLGTYKKTLGNGVSWIIPIIDRVTLKGTLKENVLDFPEQDVITRDNVTMKIDTVVYMQITDSKLYAYGVGNPLGAVENITATTLRNLVGDLELDETLTSRDTVNEKLRAILDDATDPWGMKILRVELKNILPPLDIRKAMEKQMRAEREKRESILNAEGAKAAAVLRAEGQKSARILAAEGEKASQILAAEGEKESKILVAEGKGRAIEIINESKPSMAAIQLLGYEALTQAAEGDSNTILMPSELVDVAKMTTAFGAINNSMKSNRQSIESNKE